MKILSILSVALMLTACATHKPAKMPSGTPFPINPPVAKAVIQPTAQATNGDTTHE